MEKCPICNRFMEFNMSYLFGSPQIFYTCICGYDTRSNIIKSNNITIDPMVNVEEIDIFNTRRVQIMLNHGISTIICTSWISTAIASYISAIYTKEPCCILVMGFPFIISLWIVISMEDQLEKGGK